MKVIDLLNKKANGEELPSEINCYNQAFYLSDGIYIAKNQVGKFFEDYFDFSSLDYEVEIIEDTPKENKRIEKISKLYKYKEENGEEYYENTLRVYDGGEYEINEDMSFVIDKINEIINKINRGE